MSLRTPRIVEKPWPEALRQAQSAGEPVFVPISAYADDRGWSLMNLMTGVMSDTGQVNFSMQYPGVIKAWHRHQEQTDFWTCIHGHLRAGVHREDDGASWSVVMGEMKPGVLIIPPTLWHGAATVGHRPAGLLYYVTRAYNPESPDEERAPHNAFADFPWSVQHR